MVRTTRLAQATSPVWCVLFLVSCTANPQVPGTGSPAAPSLVLATPIDGGVRLEWQDNSSNETAFLIFREITTTAAGIATTAFEQIDQVRENTTEYEDRAVGFTAYRYAVAAANQSSISDPVPQLGSEGVVPKLATPAIRVGSSRSTLSYEVDQNGNITIEQVILSFSNAAAARAALVTQYQVESFDANGMSLEIDVGAVDVFVPAGVLCPNPVPAEGCVKPSPDAVFGSVSVMMQQGVNLLDVGVVQAHISAGFPIGWYVEVRAIGVDVTGVPFVGEASQLQIAAPN